MPGAMHAPGAIQATLSQIANGCQLLLTDINYILLLLYGILLSLFITQHFRHSVRHYEYEYLSMSSIIPVPRTYHTIVV